MTKYIYDRHEHNLVLFELGLLDDDDDWTLYQLQEDRFRMSEEDDAWDRYVVMPT